MAGVLYFLLDCEESGPWAAAVRLLLLGGLSFLALGWTRNVRMFPDAFPGELEAAQALALSLGSIVFGAASFAAARGRRGFSAGVAFGLLSCATGWCASRWPQLCRAIELSGGVFTGMIFAALLTFALAATHILVALALLRADWRGSRAKVIWSVVASWALATAATQSLLALGWGFGPRSLSEAAGVPSNRDARRLAVAWLYPTRGRSHHIDARLMSSHTTDLSLGSLRRLESFLERTRFRGVFAEEALAAVRLGYLQWWDEERALDAMMISVPGRAHPDYRRALELIRAGPLSAERLAKLEILASLSGRRVEGFERAGESQLIFEGFSAAYARFGDEANARVWLRRLDGLWSVSEKRIEVGALEDLRDGRVEGAVFLDESPAIGLRVGLFLVWNSSVTQTTNYWLSGSRIPDEDGRFSFEGLGPGRYVVALLGRPGDLRAAYVGLPGYVEVTYERPFITLKAIRLARETSDSQASFGPGNELLSRVPKVPEPPLTLWR